MRLWHGASHMTHAHVTAMVWKYEFAIPERNTDFEGFAKFSASCSGCTARAVESFRASEDLSSFSLFACWSMPHKRARMHFVAHVVGLPGHNDPLPGEEDREESSSKNYARPSETSIGMVRIRCVLLPSLFAPYQCDFSKKIVLKHMTRST